MGDAREAVYGRLSQRSIDEETVVVADECEGYYAYGFEYTRVDHYGASQLASRFWGDAEGLCDDRYNDNDHTDKRETACFGELYGVLAQILLGAEV